MRTKLRSVFKLLAMLALSTINLQRSTCFAQGTAFTYQGRLTLGGASANGNWDLTFKLYDAASAGSQVGATLTNSAVTVNDGLFTTTLDFGANFPGANRWLELAARTNGGGAFATVSPRQQITPTPYAIYANTASNVTGTVTLAQLPATVVTNGASGVSITGTFSGNGAGLSNLTASLLTTNAAFSTNAWLNPVATNTYSSAGTYSLTVPANVGRMVVKLWGAGGGSTGAGAFSQVTLKVNPGDTYVAVVGQAGASGGAGGGNASNDAGGGNGNGFGPGGGQGSSLFLSNAATSHYIMKAVAGGGAGGPGTGTPAGVAGPGGFNDYSANATTTGETSLSAMGGNGQGGFQTGSSPFIFNWQGSGGGYGGGSSSSGGGSYGDVTVAGTNAAPGNTSDPNYVATSATPTHDGLVVVIFYYVAPVAYLPETVQAISFVGDGSSLTNVSSAALLTPTSQPQYVSNGLTSATATNTYSSAGTYSLTVPANAGRMVVKLWGAGGGSTGAGAFSQVTLKVNPGDTYVAVVGQAGASGGAGGGNASNDAGGGNGNGFGPGGGQGSSLFLSNAATSHYIMKAVAGGGAGGPGTGTPAGVAGPGGFNDYSANATTTGETSLSAMGGNGQGGFQTGSSPFIFNWQGSGGGYGGGSSSSGGGSYGDVTVAGTNAAPGNTSDPNYVATSATPTHDGLVVVVFYYPIAYLPEAVQATAFVGDGSSLSNLAASQIQGTLSDTLLSTNVALRAGGNTFSGTQIITNGNVGLGTTSPQTGLDILGTGTVGQGISHSSVALRVRSTASYGSMIAVDATQLTGGDSWQLFSTGGNAGEGNGKFIIRSSNTGSEPITVLNNGNVGIGTTGPNDTLDVNGPVRATGFRGRNGVSGGNISAYPVNIYPPPGLSTNPQLWVDNLNYGPITTTSDRRLKEHIQPLADDGLARLMALKPVSFNYRDVPGDKFRGNPEVMEGFIADEVQSVIPSGVNGEKDAVTDTGGIQPQTLNVVPIVSVVTKAAQELARKVEAQEAELIVLRAEKAALADKLASIEKTVAQLAAESTGAKASLKK